MSGDSNPSLDTSVSSLKKQKQRNKQPLQQNKQTKNKNKKKQNKKKHSFKASLFCLNLTIPRDLITRTNPN